ITATASGSSSVVAVLNPVKPSIATTSSRSRQAWGRSASQVLKTCFERPSTMSNSRDGPVASRIGVRSMITVTYLSPRRVWRQLGRAVAPCGVCPLVGFHSPPAEPGVRLSPHRALHVRFVGQLVRAAGWGVHGVGIWYRYRGYQI